MKNILYFWFFPRRCLQCGRVIAARSFYCEGCREKMPFVGEERCEKCGCELQFCRCGQKSKHYDAVLAPFYYTGSAKKAVLKAKRYPIYAEPLAAECAKVFERYYGSIPFDFVCAVPMSRARRHGSGFNHSSALAKELADRLELPFYDCLKVVGEGAPQHTLPSASRSGNVRGMYDVEDESILKDKTVLLADDIKTSGATLDECALMLRLNGAKAVYALCACVAKEEYPRKEERK